MTKLCKDCEHYRPPLWIGRTGLPSLCGRPIGEGFNLQTGGYSVTLGGDASNERKPGRTWFGLGRERCGPEAQFFEQRRRRPGPPPPSRDA
jgi:hypothetical protein